MPPAVGIGAGGVVGLAVEATSGTYTAPTKFFPIRSENFQWTQDTVWRRVIRGTADVIGAVPGNGHVEGDLDMELLEDVLPYLLLAARGDLTDTAGGYEFVPTSGAVPEHTLSFTIVRNEQVFGYTGVVVPQMSFSIDNGMMVVTYSMLGQEEDEAAAPTHSFDDDGPFGAGTYDVQIPTGTTVEDTDALTIDINDNGEVQNRLIDRRGAAFISFGERDVQITVERDFVDKTQYNEFLDLTANSITIRTEKLDAQGDPSGNFVEFSFDSAIIDSYEIPLSGVGDLIRGSTTYICTDTPTGDGSYKIEIGTDEAGVVPGGV